MLKQQVLFGGSVVGVLELICLSVANCVTYFLEDFILEGGKVGYGGAYLAGQRMIGRRRTRSDTGQSG